MNRYWVGGTGVWSDTTHWSATDGGAGGASVPTSADDVFVTPLSGFGAGGTITLDVLGECNDFTSTSGHTYTIAEGGGSFIYIYGSAIFEGSITFTTDLQFVANTTENITSNGMVLPATTFDGVGGTWIAQDDLSFDSTETVSFYNGTFDANDKNITGKEYYFYADTGYTPTIIMGSGTWEAEDTTGGTSLWLTDENNGEVVTFVPETSTIKLIANNVANNFSSYVDGELAAGTHVYNNIWLTGAGTGWFAFYGNHTFNEFKVDTPPHTVFFYQDTTTRVASFPMSGTLGNAVELKSDNEVDQFLLEKTTAGQISLDFVDIYNSYAQNVIWSQKYLAYELPEDATPAWTFTGTAITKEINPVGYLHIVSDQVNQFEYTETNLDNTIGTTVEFRMKVISAGLAVDAEENCPAFQIQDGTYAGNFQFYADAIRCELTTNEYPFVTTDAYHKYRITLQGSVLKLYADDVLIATEVAQAAGIKRLQLIPEWSASDPLDVESSWDYVYWCTTGAFAPNEGPVQWIALGNSVDGGNNDGWLFTDSPAHMNYKRAITIDSTKVVGADKIDFPVLFSTIDPRLKSVANGGHVESANGYDIAFYANTDLTVQLDHEILKYDPVTGEFVAFFRQPILQTAVDDVVYLGYGNPAITSSMENVNGVWNASYKTVWHGKEASGQIKDSTANAHDSTIETNVQYQQTGQFGYAIGGAADADVYFPSTGFPAGGDPRTVQIWLKSNDIAGAGQFTHAIGYGQWLAAGDGIVLGHDTRIVRNFGAFSQDGQDINTDPLTIGGAWHKLSIHIAGSGAPGQHLYLDGDYVASGTFTVNTVLLHADLLGIGGSPSFNGLVQEGRIVDMVLGADWEKTEWYNQSSPSTFYTLGTEVYRRGFGGKA